MALPTTFTDAYGAVIDTGRNTQLSVNLVWVEQHRAAEVGTDTGTKGLTITVGANPTAGNATVPHFDSWQSYVSPR